MMEQSREQQKRRMPKNCSKTKLLENKIVRQLYIYKENTMWTNLDFLFYNSVSRFVLELDTGGHCVVLLENKSKYELGAIQIIRDTLGGGGQQILT